MINVNVFFSLQEHLQGLVSHMTSPFEGLKKVLFYLFTEEELRCSSVKGITTVAGGANTALDKEKLSSLYSKSMFFLF